MKIKCNVHKDCGIVELTIPQYEGELALCPCCDKQLAFAVKPFRKPLFWQPIDTALGYTKDGRAAVEVLTYTTN